MKIPLNFVESLLCMVKSPIFSKMDLGRFRRSEALKAIEVAYVEATCNANCIGLVKLMGRCWGRVPRGTTIFFWVSRPWADGWWIAVQDLFQAQG